MISVMRINLNLKSTLILICVVYTLLTITSSGYALLVGITTATHFHLLARFAVTAIGIGSILMFNLFPRWPLWVMFALHYTATMGIIFLLMWVSSFFIELHPDAYRDIFFNFTPIYLLIAAIFVIRNKFRK
ncbi:DUF6608 family protein [Natranaerofaba carboxydovora]|uniref:DUF6608 family protein n=1 Tax=Natranaerofaba carboxydovora TaxID=2742683 RepID=UPI001F129F2F|nr:DUF6608 family protein [Natranaerofaba carboxydovora]